MSKIHFSGHQFHLDRDYRIFKYYDTDKDKIYRHSHDFYELYMLVSGHVKYFIAGSSFYLAPGDFLFINQYQEHFPEVLDFSVPYERMAIHVLPETLKALSTENVDLTAIFSRNEFKVYHYPPAIHGKIQVYVDQLYELYNTKDVFGADIRGRGLLALLFVLLNQYMDAPSVYSFDRHNKDIQLLQITENYIRRHIQDKITVETLGKYLFMNQYYFMHQFKEIAGMTVYQFVQKTRMNVLRELVEEGCPLTAAAQQAGFRDYSNFFRYFKKTYGMNPNDYFKHPGFTSSPESSTSQNTSGLPQKAPAPYPEESG